MRRTVRNKPLGDWLKEQLERKGWRQADLARKSGLTTAEVSYLVLGKGKKPDPDTIDKLARGLEVPIEQVYRAAGYMEKAPEASEILEEMQYWYERMTPEEREEWLQNGKLKVELRRKRAAGGGTQNNPPSERPEVHHAMDGVQ